MILYFEIMSTKNEDIMIHHEKYSILAKNMCDIEEYV